MTDLGAAPCGVEVELPDNAQLLRSVAHDPDALEWSEDDQRWLPTAKAMQFDDDCSTFWHQHLQDIHARGANDVADEGRPLVYEVTANLVRALGFGARHSPEGDEPNACAHSSVDWPGQARPSKPERNRLRTGLVRGMALVCGEVLLTPPPGA